MKTSCTPRTGKGCWPCARTISRGRPPHYEVEYRLRNKAGGWKWILSRGKAVTRDDRGRATRIIGTLTDITRLKEVESELLRSQAELEQRVQERTAELYESNVALKVVLQKREEDRLILADQVLANTSKLVDTLPRSVEGKQVD